MQIIIVEAIVSIKGVDIIPITYRRRPVLTADILLLG